MKSRFLKGLRGLRTPFRLGGLVAVLVLCQLHCDKEKPTGSGKGEGIGAIMLEVRVPALPVSEEGTAKATITQGVLLVSGEGMAPHDTTLLVQEGRIRGTLYGIPVGERTVSLSLQEAGGNPVWESRTTVLVEAGKTVPCVLVLQRVGDTPPQTDFQVTPEVGKTETAFAFQAQVSDRHDPTDSLQVRWDFDSDGKLEVEWTLEKTAHHVFGAAGSYRVALEAKDRSGKTRSFTRRVQVIELRAQTGVNPGPDSLQARLTAGTVTLNGSGSQGWEGQPLTYHWDQVLDYPGTQNVSVMGTFTDNNSEKAARISFEPKAGRGWYVFTLRVEVAGLQSEPDTLFVQVRSLPPVVSVSPPEGVEAGQSLTLQGQATDGDGDALTYRWRGESVALLSDTTSRTPVFSSEAPGEYVFTFLAIDTDPQESEPAEVVVTVVARNDPPVADAGEEVARIVGEVVQLDGRGSRDPEEQPLGYTWTQKEGPTVVLQGSDTATPTFTPGTAGRYVFSLVVSDGEKESVPDEVGVIVQANLTPVAHAGEDQVVQVGASGALDGRGSQDAEGAGLEYRWTAPPEIILSSSTGVRPPFSTRVAGVFRVTLVVSDGYQDSAPDTVVIRVNTPPVADAGVDQETPVGSVVSLDGSGSRDGDGDVLSYQWSTLSGVVLSDVTVSKPTFEASAVGTYRFYLVVNDGKVNSVPDTVAITVVQPNRAPVADAGSDQSVEVGTTAPLDGRSSSDPDGDALRYRWTEDPDNPASGLLSTVSATQPTFTPSVVGVYRFSLAVSDGQVESTPDTVVITVVLPNRAPVADAGPDQSAPVGATVQLEGSGSRDPEGDALTYRWSAPAGVGLNDPTAMQPEWVAVKVGTYRFTLVVNDGELDSAPDTVVVTVVQPNRPPVADAGPDQRVEVGVEVALDGSGSSDADGDALTYRWTAPAGIVLSHTAATRPTFTARAVGVYRFTLMVNDGAVESAPAEVVVVVNLPGVRFADPNLEAAVRVAIGKPEGDILPAEVAGLTSLNVRGWKIAKLEGMEQLTALEELFLDSNPLNEISALSALTSLVILEIANSQVSDLSALSALSSLKHLYLPNNQIRDIAVLSTLTSLETLELNRNPIREFSALSVLTALQTLHLMDTQLSDLSALSALTSLADLKLGGNQIRDLSPLVANRGIGAGDKVDLRENPLSEAALSAQIPALQGRGVEVLFDMPVVPEPVVTEEITVDLPGGATMEMVWIEPGTFLMGSPDSDELSLSTERPQHWVTITKGFWLGKYEVTQGQWERVMGTRPWSGQSYVQANPTHPAVHISWEDVQEFIHRLNQAAGDSLYRLPTEAEREYACRARTSTVWSFGNDETLLKEYAWYRDNAWEAGLQYAQPVGTKRPNPWGLYDMHGNVWEWVQDWFGPYSSDSQTDPTGPASGSDRVLRGGGVGSYAQHVRSARRHAESVGYRWGSTGVRLVRMESPISVNIPPEAKAGVDQTVAIGATVQLDGRGSFDADGDALMYRWTAPAGIALSSETAVRPTFTATTAGTYRFTLVVNDGQVDSAPDTVVITVQEVTTPRKTLTVDLPGGMTMEFVWIEPGTFTMGTIEWEQPHEVTISKGYYLGRYEITQGQWARVTGTRPWVGFRKVQENPACPAVNISWNDVQDFIHRLNQAVGDSLYRLPTEAEWEYACRAGTTTQWSFGNDESQLRDYAWYEETTRGEEYPHAVGTKKPNPWGLYDMHGNVWEWVQDWYGLYASENQRDPMGPVSGDRRVMRGGGYDYPASDVRSSFRGADLPGVGGGPLGARLVRMAEPLPRNRPPVAKAGADQTLTVGATVILNGSGSYDPEGAPLIYRWSGPAGVGLNDPTAIQPEWVAVKAGIYRFTLVVNDGELDSAPDGVAVVVVAPFRIAFASDREGNAEIFTINLDGSDPIRLTHNDSYDFEPQVSPDGARIAFTAFRDGHYDSWGNPLGEIYVMDADGRNPVNLSGTPANAEGEPSWSPDSRQIAFVSDRPGNHEIYVMNADGSGLVNLSQHPGGDRQPSWSPDGRKIAFAGLRELDVFGAPTQPAVIYVMNADGGNQLKLTQHPAEDVQPAWSPDGRQIAFVTNRDGNYEIYAINADGSDPVNLTRHGATDQRPAWSPDGRRIAFVSDRGGSLEIYLMDADGSDVRKLVEGFGNADWPSWLPGR